MHCLLCQQGIIYMIMFIPVNVRSPVKVCAFAAMFFFAAACPLTAQILNGNFDEDPNFPVGWVRDTNGYAPQVTSTFTAADSNRSPVYIGPVDGPYFLRLNSGGGALSVDLSYSQLTQEITINAGQSIAGSYFFSTLDYIIDPPNPTGNYKYNDKACIKLVPTDPCSGLVEITLAYKDVNSVGSYGEEGTGCMPGWATFSRTFDSNDAGNYTLTLRIWDFSDTIYPSYLAVDALKLCYPPLGDINHDCVVNFLDFTLMANQWLNDCSTPTWCNNTDINPIPQGSKVDFEDLMIMAANWLIDCDATPGDPECLPPAPP
jgi:hypothetical protein